MNRHQSINLRQLCIGYFLYSISIKILTLPSTLAAGSGNLAWITALFGSVFEIGTVILITLLLKSADRKPRLFRTICWLLIPVIIAEIWLSSVQIYHIAYTDLFTNLSWVIFVITLVMLGCFFITRQPRAVFRTGEIIWLFFALGLAIAIVPTLYQPNLNWQNLWPGNFTNVIKTAGSNLWFFESATYVLAFGSETKKSNREIGKINLTALLCGIGYSAFMVWFVLLFGPLTRYKNMGLIDLTTAAQFLTTTGSLDWLIVIALLSALVLRFGVQLVALVTLIKRGMNRHA